MRALFCGLIFLLIAPAAASAASFDCAKSTAPVEKMICADPALSKADETLAEAYKAELAATLDRETTRSEQHDWLKTRDATETPSALQALYDARIAALQQQAADDREARIIPAADTTSGCVAVSKADADVCRVIKSGPVGDPALGLSFKVQYLDVGGTNYGSNVVILKALSGVPARYEIELLAENDQASLDEPYFADAAGTLLVVEGTANFSQHHFRTDQAFLFANGAFEPVNVDRWQDDLKSRLPDGMINCSDIKTNYRKMTVQFGGSVYRNKECHATDARATVKLALKDHTLVVADLKYEPGKKTSK